MKVLLPGRVSAETSDETAQEMARAPVVPGPRSLPVRPRKTDRKRSTRIAPRTEVPYGVDILPNYAQGR